MELEKDITKVDTEILWALISDITMIMSQKKYTPDVKNPIYMYWYDEYQRIIREIDHRLSVEYDKLPF